MALNIPSNLPAATIAPTAALVEPAGWLFMAGQAISRVTYSALFLAIGTTYGIGDGSTTFNIPDARGRSLFGRDDMGGTAANRATSGGGGLNGVALGAVGGGETVTLATAQMPSHAHIHNTHGHTGGGSSGDNMGGGGLGGSSPTNAGVATSSVISTESTQGTSGAHTNMPPSIIVNYIIKT